MLPLLRALARVRTTTQSRGDALAKATVVRALGEKQDLPPARDLRAWMLGLQRAILADGLPVDDAPATGRPARGANATWHRLHEALLELPDPLRETVFLGDGAGFGTNELAQVLGCGENDAARRHRHARAALLRQLEPATSLNLLPAYGACARRPPGARRPAARRLDPPATLPSQAGAEVVDEGLDFARRLNIALYRTLLRETVDMAERRGIEALIIREAEALARQRRHATERSSAHGRGTSWLRLMFIAYSCPDQGRKGL